MITHNQKTGDITIAVKELAAAVSTQLRFANRAWLILVGAAVLTLFPPSQGNSEPEKISLLFLPGSVNSSSFYPTVFALLSVLMVAFAAAHAQAVRAERLAHNVLATLKKKGLLGIHPKDLYDMFRIAGFNRVAPLAQLLRGKYQFRNGSFVAPRWALILTAIYYVLLKIVAVLAYWALPGYAYLFAFLKARGPDSLPWYQLTLFVIASVAFLSVAVADLVYVVRTFRILASQQDIDGLSSGTVSTTRTLRLFGRQPLR